MCSLLATASLLCLGCTKTEPTTVDAPSAESEPDLRANSSQQLVGNDRVEPIPSDSPTSVDPNAPFEPFGADDDLLQSSEPMPVAQDQRAEAAGNPAEPLVLEAETPNPESPPQIRSDLTPGDLVKFLASADEDMQLIHSNRAGIEDPREARDTLVKIVDMKLQASRQLSAHPQATENQKSEGNRGELQSLSHLAALSNVNAANELEALAESNMSSADPKLVADSRLVLIGFAIESVQNGDEAAAEKIVQYADQIAGSDTAADVPALVVLGQAKQVLESFGHADQGKQIRDRIIDKFADSKNPDVANMAAQFAGNVVYDEVDQLRDAILKGESVTVEQWVGSVETLIEKSADMQTVGYLAGASVDFEANAKIDFADATLGILQARFNEPDAATTREVKTAIEATRARQEIIGKEFDPELRSVSGSPLQMSDYRGKVVLVPFWGMGIPLSLQPIPILQSVRDKHPDHIAIVGVNLDSEDAPVQAFTEQNKIDFPSFRLSTDPPSPIPKDFGMVSMPFVVILDSEGKVAAIQLSDHGLQENLKRLLPDSAIAAP